MGINMNERKFLKGFLTGMLCSLLVLGAAGFGFYIFTGGGNAPAGALRSYNLNPMWIKGDYDKKELDKETIFYKLQYLQNMIDKYFLFEQDPDAIADGIYSGLMNSLDDRYSGYYNEKDYKALQESSSGTYYGIGVQVTQNVNTGIITVTRVFSGSPALESGLLPGDTIYKVEDMEVTGMDLNNVVSHLKGGEGTTVRVEIFRPSINDYVVMDVERRNVEIDTISHKMLTDRIGYIQLMEFDGVTYDQFMQAYGDLNSQGMEALMLDLRGNPGGLINSATDILDEFLPEGIVVYTEDKNGQGETYMSDEERQINIPLVVLVDGSSASASELFASAIKDYEWGTIVGTTTFGKGIMQNLIPLGDGSAMKITVGNFFTKSGYLIHENGVEPDVEVDLPDEMKIMPEVPVDQDTQIQSGIEVLNGELQ